MGGAKWNHTHPSPPLPRVTYRRCEVIWLRLLTTTQKMIQCLVQSLPHIAGSPILVASPLWTVQHHMTVTRLSYDGHMTVTRLLHDCHTTVTWLSQGCYMIATQLSHDCHKAVTWLTYKCNVQRVPVWRIHELTSISVSPSPRRLAPPQSSLPPPTEHQQVVHIWKTLSSSLDGLLLC